MFGQRSASNSLATRICPLNTALSMPAAAALHVVKGALVGYIAQKVRALRRLGTFVHGREADKPHGRLLTANHWLHQRRDNRGNRALASGCPARDRLSPHDAVQHGDACFGKALSNTDSKTGLQDAVTPPWDTAVAMAIYAGIVVAVPLTWWLSGWQLALASLAIILLGGALLKALVFSHLRAPLS